MNCTCIERIEKELVGRDFKKKKIQKATIPTGILFLNKSAVCITGTDIELVVEGFNRPQKQTIVHSFCPFCGEKIQKE